MSNSVESKKSPNTSLNKSEVAFLGATLREAMRGPWRYWVYRNSKRCL